MVEGDLQAALEAARSERRLQCVLLAGAEGVGRSHVLATLPGTVVDAGRGPLLAQTLRALLGECAHDDAALQALATGAALEDLEPERAVVAVELLASLLGIRRPQFVTASLDEDSRREGAGLELARWIVERAQQDVFVIAFDDAHLAEDDGAAFLEALTQREEPVPLVIVVSYDSAAARLTPAFRARRDRWLTEGRWRRLEVKAPPVPVVEELVQQAGASASQASELVRHAGGNPALALGLWSALRDGAATQTLPTTLDGLRLLRVRALGEAGLAACATLAALDGAAPLAALAAVEPGLPAALSGALASGVAHVEQDEVCRFVDPRVSKSLLAVLPSPQVLEARRAAGAWAVKALQALEPASLLRVASVLVPLARPALGEEAVSLWDEVSAASVGGRAETAARLELALKGARGVRRLVLLRRLAEVRLFLGQPEVALELIAAAGRVVAADPPRVEPAVARVLATQHRGVLDRWDSLSLEEARVALELVRAECVSHLVKKDETQRAFQDLERRLLQLRGTAVPHLWIRWAKAWSWFQCEILGRSADALKACALVRRQVSQASLAADEDAIAFVRAEEIATCSVGEFERARALTDEHIALARRAGSLRDECLAWNARAIVHYGQAELAPAKRAFKRALELARATGWLRREAITLHNLTLVLTELNELDEAWEGETEYARLSDLIGNHAGKAEAPLVLANVELSRGQLLEAEALIAQARKVAESNGWDMLVAQARALSGRLRLMRSHKGSDSLEIAKAKNDFLAAIDVLEERSLAWTEELDPGELFGLCAVSLKWAGQLRPGQALIARGLSALPVENVVSRRQLEVAQALLGAQPIEERLQWFEERGFARRVALWRALA